MRKTDKKRDKMIREALTQACDIALENHIGFQWLTHSINYDAFPQSLMIICVFNTNEALSNADTGALGKLIQSKLSTINIQLRDNDRQLLFDSEENCRRENNGNWNQRLSHH